MENLQRDLGRLRREYAKFPVLEQTFRERWSLVLVGSRGRILKLSLKWGFIVFSFAAFLFVILGAGLWHFSRLGWEYAESRVIPRGEIDGLRRENHQLMARLAVLETQLGERAVFHEQEEEGLRGESQELSEDIPPVKESEPENFSTAEELELEQEEGEPISSGENPPDVDVVLQKVAIDDYVAGLRDGEYRVSFNIRNLVNDTGISGHIISVLIPENLSSPYLASPSLAVQEGKPVDPLKGQFFSIRRFKDVRLRFGNIDIRQFKKNRIFVYNEAGLLLYVQEFEVIAPL